MFSNEEKDGRVVLASWEDVLILIGIPYRVRRTSWVIVAECPFCHSPSKKMNLWEKSGRFKCSDCPEEGDKADLIHQVYPQRTLSDIFSQFGESSRPRRLPISEHPELTFS